MSASKNNTAHNFVEYRIGSDLAKVDAHVIQPEEYDEIPELTDEMMSRADVYIGDRLVRRGRFATVDAEAAEAFRLPPGIVAHFRAGGPDWQERIETILLDAIAHEKIGS